MQRFVGCVTVTVALTVFTAVPSVFARPGGSAGPVHQPPYGGWGGSGGGWNHRHDGDHFGFSFYGAFPFGWPYYGPPYYGGYYDYPPTYVTYNPPVYYYDGAYSYPKQDNRSYLVLGHDWGKDLRLQTVTWEWFVQYLRAYIINAPPGVQDDFRRGFIDGYGDSALSVLGSAMQQARQAAVQPPPPPQSGSTTTSAPPGSATSIPAHQK